MHTRYNSLQLAPSPDIKAAASPRNPLTSPRDAGRIPRRRPFRLPCAAPPSLPNLFSCPEPTRRSPSFRAPPRHPFAGSLETQTPPFAVPLQPTPSGRTCERALRTGPRRPAALEGWRALRDLAKACPLQISPKAAFSSLTRYSQPATQQATLTTQTTSPDQPTTYTTDDSDREMPDSAPSGSGGLAASSTRSGRRRQTPAATTALDSDSDDHGEPDSDDSDFESSKKDGGTKKKKKKARGTRGPAKKKGGGQKKKNKKKSGGKRKHARTSAQIREAMEARGCYNDSPRSGRPNPARGILRGEDRAPRMRASRSPCARQATH